MNTEIRKNITDSFNELDNILFAFNNEQFNKVPFEGSWTAGQVAEHIIKSLGGVGRLMNGPSETVSRDAGEKIKALDDLFLNFTVKLKAPDFIIPSNGPHDKETTLRSLEGLKKEMLNASESDLSLLCTGAEFPTFGQMTRLEWMHFFLVHTQRHTQQIKNIFHTLK